MRTLLSALILAAALPLAAPSLAQGAGTPAGAAPATNAPPNEQVIEPAVPRRPVRLPRIPNSDWELGAFVGTYSTESFGANMVYGARLGYHITEDFFVEATYGQSKVSDETFRAILPGGIFPQAEQTLRYYNLSAGYNLLPGEVFFGGRLAKASALYLIAGVGSTKFLEQNKQTVNVGLGLRIFLKDWAAIQVDFRDHVYPLDLLGRRKDTQNLELSTGVTFFF